MRTPWPAALGLFLLFQACAPVATSPPTPDAGVPSWHVRDGFLRDAQDRAVILRGVNLSGRHKNAPYFDFHQPEDFAVVRTAWGMNAIRFLVEWAAVEPEAGVYDDAYLDKVAQRMDWAQDAGLLVVLDMHQDVYGEGFLGGNGAPRWTCPDTNYAAFVPQAQWYLSYLDPNVVDCFDRLWGDSALQDHFAKAWLHVAQRLAGKTAVVGFDVLNEPYLGSFSLEGFEPQALQPFYERVVPMVRQAAPHWVAFLEPSSMRNLGFPTKLTPFPFPNVVYAPHSYETSAEQGMGFDPARRSAVLENAAKLAQEAASLQAALWVGEYGGTASAPNIGSYMDAEYDAVAQTLGGSMYWSYSRDPGYGLQEEDGAEKPELMAALVRPYPERVAGTPQSWTFEDTTRVLELRFMPAGGDAVTIISAPARVWPQGPQVTCTNCQARVVGSQVEVTATGSGQATVVLAPPP